MKSNSCGHQWIIALTQQLSECELDVQLRKILEQMLQDNYFAVYIDKDVVPQPSPVCLFKTLNFPSFSHQEITTLLSHLDSERVRISGKDGKHCFFPILRVGV